MAFFVAKRVSRYDIRVEYYAFERRAAAEDKAAEVAKRDNLRPQDVIVVIANTDVHARAVATTCFDRIN